jgi:hypothetical protein
MGGSIFGNYFRYRRPDPTIAAVISAALGGATTTRLACSSCSFVSKDLEERYVQHLASDLRDGTWDRKWGYLRGQHEYDGSLRLIVSYP